MKQRGFEIAKGWEDQDINLPIRSTTNAAAYDIEAATDMIIPSFRPGMKPTLVPTGLKAYCQPDECFFVLNRSSGAGKGIVLANGVGLIDADYYENPENDGHFFILVVNTLEHDLKIKKHDRIAQVVFQKFLLVDDDQTAGLRQGGIGSTDHEPLRIVYDMDDVLWPCTGSVYSKLGIDINRQTDFRVYNVDGFSSEEKQKIMEAFSNVENFQNLPFFDDAKRIFEVEKLGVEVQINSNCFSEDILKVKRRQISELFPRLRPGQLKLNLVNGSASPKDIGKNVFVFIDDSPYNIAESDAKFNFMPKKPWNTTDVMRNLACEHDKVIVDDIEEQLAELIARPEHFVIPVSGLSEAIELVYQAVRLKQEGENHAKK